MLIRSICASFLLLAIMLGGCAGNSCGSCPRSGNAKFIDKCHEFFSTEDPCKDGTCTLAERDLYGKLGYECAKVRGMVPLSPKYGLPAIDCPVEFFVDTNSTCPPACAELAGYDQAPVAQAGFLVTAFDTDKGTLFVMVDANKDYDPKASLADSGKGLDAIAQRLSTADGAVAVYLTEYPLIAADASIKSRQLRDSEVDLLKQGIQSLGKAADQVKFVRWK